MRSSLTLLLVCLAGCSGKKPSEVLEEVSPDADERLKAVLAVIADCKKQPAVTKDEFPENLEGVVANAYDYSGNLNGVTFELFEKGTAFKPAFHYGRCAFEDAWWVRTLIASGSAPERFGKGTFRKKYQDLKEEAGTLNSTQYVLVLKVLERREPKAKEDNQYEFGAAKCEAHLYRLSDRKRLAAFTFVARNQVLGAAGVDFGLTSEDPQKNVAELKHRLYQKVHRFAQATLRHNVKGVRSKFALVKGLFRWDLETKPN